MDSSQPPPRVKNLFPSFSAQNMNTTKTHNSPHTDDPTSRALAAMTRAEPVFEAVVPAAALAGLDDGAVLLHAGPPLREGEAPCRPLLNAAAVAMVHEGWASEKRPPGCWAGARGRAWCRPRTTVW